APALPTIASKVAMASAGGDKSRRGNNTTPDIRKVPANAERRGSKPGAFADGRVRKRAATARSKRNAIVESRIAISSAETGSMGAMFRYWASPVACTSALVNTQPAKGNRIKTSYIIDRDTYAESRQWPWRLRPIAEHRSRATKRDHDRRP